MAMLLLRKTPPSPSATRGRGIFPVFAVPPIFWWRPSAVPAMVTADYIQARRGGGRCGHEQGNRSGGCRTYLRSPRGWPLSTSAAVCWWVMCIPGDMARLASAYTPVPGAWDPDHRDADAKYDRIRGTPRRLECVLCLSRISQAAWRAARASSPNPARSRLPFVEADEPGSRGDAARWRGLRPGSPGLRRRL